MTRCRRLFHLFCAAVFGSAVGCGNPRHGGPFSEWIDRDWSPDELAQAWSDQTGEPIARAGNSMGSVEIPDDAGPEDYVRLALRRNPAIKAAQQRVRRLANRIPQVTSLGDPMLTIAPIGEMAETAAGQVRVMTGVSQKLPFPGKLQARGDIAGLDTSMAVHDLENTRLAVIADTRRAYWSYYFTVRAIEVTTHNRQLLARFQQIAEAKYRAGAATQQDVLRASVELSNVENTLITLAQRRSTAVAMLNRLIDRQVTATLPEPPPIDPDELTLELDPLLATADLANPAIRKVHERIDVFRKRLQLAKLGRWPDLTVSFNYNLVDDEGLSRIANGEDQWWVGLGVNLPIWQEKLDAAERESARGVMEAIAELREARNRVAFRVEDAFVKVDTQQRLVILFRDVIVPQARQTVDSALGSYQAGKVDFLTLVDNWRRLLDFQLMYHQSLAQLEQSFAELQQAVGEDLDRTGRSSEQPAAPGRGPPAELETKR